MVKESRLRDVIEELCPECDLRNSIEKILSIIEDVTLRTYTWHLSATHDGYVASIYTIYLIFTENIIFDAASFILCSSSSEPRWFEAFTILSSAFMMHMIVKKEFIKSHRPVKGRFEIRFSTYRRVKEIIFNDVCKVLPRLDNVLSTDSIVIPLSALFIVMLSYLCSFDDKVDRIQHVIDVLKYSLNEDTFKIVSEYGNTTPELAM